MSEFKRSLVSAVGVTAAAIAIVGGNLWRNHVERVPSSAHVFLLDGLVASKSADADLGSVDFFHEMTKLLKREYVDPITDDQKLASGAVRGMVASLGDPKSLYFDKDEFRVFKNSQEGKYEGIGADLALQLDSPAGPKNRAGILPNADDEDESNSPEHPIGVPELVVDTVVPGGAADKAGVKVGDRVSYVDGHFLVDKESIQEFQKAQNAFRASQDRFTAGKETNGDYKRQVAAYRELHKAFRLKFQNSILPIRARDLLTAGVDGTVDVVWKRGKESRETKLTKSAVAMPSFAGQGNEIQRLSFIPGAAVRLRDAIAGKSAVTIDLRNNVHGDFEEMRKCLAVLAPTGQFGLIASGRDRKPALISVSQGNPKPPKITVIADGSTGGAAAILAQTLKDKGLAGLEGKPSNDRDVTQVFNLPDGTGYTLVTGWYSKVPDTEVAKRTHAVGKGGRP